MTLDNNYILPHKINEGCMSETIKNGFDLSWHKGETEKRVTIVKSEIDKKIIDDGSVVYIYNDDFFRCDDFLYKDDNKEIVLFAGCSETEGIGGNIEDSWPSMVLNKINSEDKSFYNLARSGWGWELILDNIRVYLQKYKTPKYLFILLPNITRRFEWDTNIKEDYSYWQRYPLFEGDIDGSSSKSKYYEESIINDREYKEALIRFMVGWRLFIDYCKRQDINVLWSTWFYPEIKNLETLNMFSDSTYIDLNLEKELEFIENHYSNNPIKKDDLKKRDGHSGRIRNLYWANRFYEEAKKRWPDF